MPKSTIQIIQEKYKLESDLTVEKLVNGLNSKILIKLKEENTKYCNSLWYSEQEVQELKDIIKGNLENMNQDNMQINKLNKEYFDLCVEYKNEIEKLQNKLESYKKGLNERGKEVNKLEKENTQLKKQIEELKSKLEHNSDKELLKALEQEEKGRKK